MTLYACVQHEPIHTFGRGYSCAKCNAPCGPPVTLWVYKPPTVDDLFDDMIKTWELTDVAIQRVATALPSALSGAVEDLDAKRVMMREAIQKYMIAAARTGDE